MPVILRWFWVPVAAGLAQAALPAPPGASDGVPIADPRLGAPDEGGTDAPGPPRPAPQRLGSLNRKLHHFDFEEAEQAPYEMPFSFYRYIAPDHGFPRFGEMRLSNTAARSGRWSFEFELDGGSLAARVPTAVIPVMPHSDYSVTAWIRTEGLSRAAARIGAELYDDRHRPLSGSRIESPAMRTGGGWQQVTIDVHGEHPDAADLVIELLVLQPAQLAGIGQNDGLPQLGDITGRVWFDDVTVWQRPRIELTTDVSGNVFTTRRDATIRVLVRDATDEPLTARVRVLDLDGRPMAATTHVLPMGAWRHAVDLADLPDGWYRVEVEVSSDRGPVGRRELPVVLLSPLTTRLTEQRFGVVLPAELTRESAAVTRQLVGHLGVAEALLPLVDERASVQPQIERGIAQDTGDALRLSGMQLTIALPGISRRLAAEPRLDHVRAGEILREQPGLTDLLMRFGLDVSRWLLMPGNPDTRRAGATGSAVLVPDADLRAQVAAVGRALGDFVLDPVVLVPWSAEYELTDLPAPHGFWITIPSSIRPSWIGDFATRWPVGQRDVFTTLARLDERYAPADRVEDLMLRTLYGWRAGLPHMAITPPWRRGMRGAVEPAPELVAWRTLAAQLDGRRYAAELAVGEGIECWLMTGGPQGTGLVAWCADGTERFDLRMLLTNGPVTVVNEAGAARFLEPRDGVHTITLGPRPVFINGVNEKLARFRAGFRVDPGYLAARHQLHDAEIVLANPWNDTISGSLRLRPPPGVRMTPRIHRFRVPPGGELRVPIDLVFNQRVLTGPAVVNAEVDLSADRAYKLRLQTRLFVGMEDVEFAAHWRPAEDNPQDLIVVESITNTGARTVNLTAYVSAPGASPQRRPISGLQSSQTAVRIFRFPGGMKSLAGQALRVGVIADDGARLNRRLEVPAPGTLPIVRGAAQ